MKRVLTAAVLIPPSVYLIFMGPKWAVLAVITLVAMLCFREYVGLMRAFGWKTLGPFGFAAGLLVLFGPQSESLVLMLVALLVMTLSLRTKDVAAVLPQSASLLLGVIYVFGSWRCAIGLHGFNPHWLFFALVLNWIGDSAAYYFGRAVGKHKLAPVLSPNKTWEGSAASVFASVLFSVVYLGRYIPELPMWEIVTLAAAANIAGQFGDLFESSLKRGAGVKDSGTLLPGHGGWLDRLDSSLFAMPLVYIWILLPWQI
jgi:phosphatidate cytidylyltransferase